ncbi:aldose epimerase family protein [Salinimicrobium soli]|uniref:aldose epimerase family protein n=1 Tax=Salinimicrobium soli TaxID=1254399 RepID=UPI003AAA375C
MNTYQQSEPESQLKVLRLKNKKGVDLEILNFGATISALKFPVKGKMINVIVGPEDPQEYLSTVYHEKGKYFGASVGRYAGRISGGGFELNGKKYSLWTQNEVHLHGGKFGFSYKFWKVENQTEGADPSVSLSYLSEDGEEGYPGNLKVSVKYTLTEDNELKIDYRATTDKETVVNLTNHVYFNLNGHGTIDNHQLQVNSEKILEVDKKQFPTGNLVSLEGNPENFREQKKINSIALDTTFVLEKQEEKENIFLKGDESGISLKVHTNQPAVVVYVPEDLPDNWRYKKEIGERRAAICLETQNYPDAPNHKNFPSALLKPGEEYHNSTTWKFRINKH